MSEVNDLDANYRRGGFGGRLDVSGGVALLLVDVCNAYLQPESPLFAGEGAQSAVAVCAELLETARSAGKPVIHTRLELRTPEDGGLFRRKVPALEVFTSGNVLADPPLGLESADGETVITKQYPSGFFGTHLDSTLRILGVGAVVIGGLSTSGCVRATALDAMQYGIAPIVVREACGDRHTSPHEAALFDLDAKYADVVDLAAGIALLQTAARP